VHGRVLPFQDIKQAEYVRKPAGVIIIDGVEVASTRDCTHCGGHFISFRGSGIRRGFCCNCMGDTCGKPECDPCRPFKQRLDDYERGKVKTLG
jgi:hypothetical protein